MDLIFSNPGYHDIAQNICKYLSCTSLTSFSKTSKIILKHSNETWLNRVKDYKNILKVYEKAGEKPANSITEIEVEFFIEFLQFETDVKLFRHIAIPTIMQRSEEYEILLKVFIEILEAIAKHGLKQIHDISEIKNYLKTNPDVTDIEQEIKEIAIKSSKISMKMDINILNVYRSIIPHQVSSSLRPHLMTVLSFAIQMEKLDLVLFLMKPLSEYDTCLSNLILALATPDYRRLYNKEIWEVKDMEELNKFIIHYDEIDQQKHAEFIRTIADRCKNPNTLNNFGATPLHLAAKFGLTEIVKVLVPICKNLIEVDQCQNTALQIAVENGYHEIVKLLTEASLKSNRIK